MTAAIRNLKKGMLPPRKILSGRPFSSLLNPVPTMPRVLAMVVFLTGVLTAGESSDSGQRMAAEPRASSDTVPSAPARVHQHLVTKPDESYRLPVPADVRNRWIRIANVGTEVVSSPRVIANGKRDWFSTPDILAGIFKPGMTDREKALAIWRFLVDNRYHDGPAHPGVEMHDPVRFLNVYGYGFCDDSAVNFAVLAGQAGLKARVWGLSGHVVPEAWFEDGWRMLDPDGEIYYLEDDGRAIAGVKTLEQRPDLISKYPSPYYKDTRRTAEIYTSTGDNKVNELRPGYAEAVHTLACSLRPGESLTRHHDNWGLYFNSHTPTRVPRRTARHHYGNGRFVFEPVWADGVFAKGAERVDRVRAERGRDGWVLRSDGGEACLGYRFAGPYPYLDGSVKITGDGRVTVAFSEDGATWTDLWTSAASGGVDKIVPLGGVFRTRVGRPVYAYHLRLTFDGRIQTLRFTGDIQVAPASLPALERGVNAIRYRDDSGGERRVAIEFGYDVSDAPGAGR